MNEKPSNKFIDIINKMNQRELLFTWYSFGQPSLFELKPHNISSLREALLNFCMQNWLDIRLVHKLENDFKNYLIDEKNLGWIDKKDIRLLSYLLQNLYYINQILIPIYKEITEINELNDKLRENVTLYDNDVANSIISLSQSIQNSNKYFPNKINQTGFKIPPYQDIPIFSNDLYSAFLYHIDLLSTPSEEKVKLIKDLKNRWDFILYDPISIRWIEENNTMQLEWIWNYHQKHNQILPNYFPLFESSLYNKILIIIDGLNFQNRAERKIYLDTMRKTWSQRKFRESNKVKKPYHLPLTKITHSKLEDLAKLKNIGKEDVIEQLVAEEYSKYADENGKLKY